MYKRQVYLPCVHDIHQDHGTVSAEGIRAFKNVSILGYEMPWNNLTFDTSGFVVLSETDIRKKADAMNEYGSQVSRAYTSREFLHCLARTRGTQIGAEYAEAFQVIRWVRAEHEAM